MSYKGADRILPVYYFKKQLNSGYDFPLIGLGTFGGKNGPEQIYSAVKDALEVGYKHLDTAYISLGKAIKEIKIPLEELFITTKLWNDFHKPEHFGPVF
ncbi:MAG: NADP-dependent oxidoreductase domain-containing protein [Benjaminiella poitrasii]|nr:MAG: NADP-dependent oxidoreductase domain-containing protein [Benjaminiella poitrasii]